MGYPETAEGFMVHDHDKWSTFKKEEFPLKPFGDYDIDVAIEACGVCGSDVHSVTGGWGALPLPVCVGHEIIGRAVKIGKEVRTVKEGDRVGVGAQIGADLDCDFCKDFQENYCPNMVDTYGSQWPDGTKTQGGYASHIRAHEYFTFRIPDGLDSVNAAPMLCAGITVYSPLVRLGAGPGKKVAIVGLGGLGHYAVLFSNALGAETYVISHSPNKKDDCMKLGAKGFISSGDKDWHKPWHGNFDFILNCADATDKFNLSEYFSTMKVGGRFHNVGLPDNDLPAMNVKQFVPGQYYMGGSHLGNRQEMQAMLKLAAEKNIKGWVEGVDISEAGCKKVVEGVKDGKPRYRYTLTNFDAVFGKRY